MNDEELARRSILGFGEIMAALGQCGTGPEAVIRRADALGARVVTATGNPWFDGVVVPPGVTPPADDAELPSGVWTLASSVAGRVEQPDVATPCMGLDLASFAPSPPGTQVRAEEVSFAILGEINERAYNDVGVFGPLARALAKDERIRAYGLRGSPEERSDFVCVALTLTTSDDLGIHYVATEAAHRRRGLASSLVRSLLESAKAHDLRSATLQASAEGLPVWKGLGFRSVATLRGFVRRT
jgi:GNAT superfamily N-acetyltransferase